MDGLHRSPTPERRHAPLPKRMAKILPGSILNEVYVSLSEHRKCHIHRSLQITHKALNMLLSRFYESVIPSVFFSLIPFHWTSKGASLILYLWGWAVTLKPTVQRTLLYVSIFKKCNHSWRQSEMYSTHPTFPIQGTWDTVNFLLANEASKNLSLRFQFCLCR